MAVLLLIYLQRALEFELLSSGSEAKPASHFMKRYLPSESRAKSWCLQPSQLLLFNSDCAQCKFLTCRSLLLLQLDGPNNNTLLCSMHDKTQKMKWNDEPDASDIIALQLPALVTDFIIIKLESVYSASHSWTVFRMFSNVSFYFIAE